MAAANAFPDTSTILGLGDKKLFDVTTQVVKVNEDVGTRIARVLEAFPGVQTFDGPNLKKLVDRVVESEEVDLNSNNLLAAIRAWTNSRSPVEQKAQGFVNGNFARMPNKVRLADFIDRIDRFFQRMQINRVSLFRADIIKMLNSSSYTKSADLLGLTYSIRGADGAVIKTGEITKNTEISLPATDDYSLTIFEFTITGTDILHNYPQFQTWTTLEKTLLWGIFVASAGMMALGFVTQMWTLWDVLYSTHSSIYWTLQQMFGTGFANVVIGQFRDIAAYVGAFAWIFLNDTRYVKRNGIGFMVFALSLLPFFSIYLEFYQAKIRGDYVDVADLLAFSIVPLSGILYGLYSYIRYLLLPKTDKVNQSPIDESHPKQVEKPSAFLNFLNTHIALINVIIFSVFSTGAVLWVITIMAKHHLPYSAYSLPVVFLFIFYRLMYDLLKTSAIKQSMAIFMEFFRNRVFRLVKNLVKNLIKFIIHR